MYILTFRMAAQVSLCPDMLTKYIHYKQIKSKKGLEKDSLGHWTKNKEFLLTDCAAGHFPQISLSSQTCCPGNYNTCYDIHPTAAKKRNTANKKERRRTKSINSAFSLLRTKIPNVPIDTKLSKIKTLKLAILYIKYLLESLDGSQDLKNGIRFEMVPLMLGTQSDRKCCDKKSFIVKERIVYDKGQGRNKGRTGWPQEVWESELNPEENKVITHKKNQCVT